MPAGTPQPPWRSFVAFSDPSFVVALVGLPRPVEPNHRSSYGGGTLTVTELVRHELGTGGNSRFSRRWVESSHGRGRPPWPMAPCRAMIRSTAEPRLASD